MKPLNAIGKKFGKLTPIRHETRNGRRFWVCQCECGGETLAFASSLKNGTRVSCGCNNTEAHELVGKRFGMLTIVARIGYDETKKGSPLYRCLCDCGHEFSASSKNIKRAQTPSCGCYLKENRARRVPSDNRSARNRVMDSYKRNAKTKGQTFDLSAPEALLLFDGLCHYCGKQPSTTLKTKSGSTFTYNGIDRKDPKKGYAPSNVVSCCKTCNFMKSDYTYQEFIDFIGAIAQHMRLG